MWAGRLSQLWVSKWMHLWCKLLPSSITMDKRVHLHIITQIILVSCLPKSFDLSKRDNKSSILYTHTHTLLPAVKCLSSVMVYLFLNFLSDHSQKRLSWGRIYLGRNFYMAESANIIKFRIRHRVCRLWPLLPFWLFSQHSLTCTLGTEPHLTICRSPGTPGHFMPLCSCACCPLWLEFTHPAVSWQAQDFVQIAQIKLLQKSCAKISGKRGVLSSICSHTAVFNVYTLMA